MSPVGVLLFFVGVIKKLNIEYHLSNMTVDLFYDIPIEDLYFWNQILTMWIKKT